MLHVIKYGNYNLPETGAVIQPINYILNCRKLNILLSSNLYFDVAEGTWVRKGDKQGKRVVGKFFHL